jgi:hypothetical protein
MVTRTRVPENTAPLGPLSITLPSCQLERIDLRRTPQPRFPRHQQSFILECRCRWSFLGVERNQGIDDSLDPTSAILLPTVRSVSAHISTAHSAKMHDTEMAVSDEVGSMVRSESYAAGSIRWRCA